VRALSHTKPKYIRNLESLFFPCNSTYLILYNSFEVLTLTSKQALHLQEVFLDTEQGPCLEIKNDSSFYAGGVDLPIFYSVNSLDNKLVSSEFVSLKNMVVYFVCTGCTQVSNYFM
jgi:hypothetical protein